MTETLSLRTERKDEVRQERRRRDDSTIDGAQRLKLRIPEDVAKRLEAEGREPYWANDTGNRIHDLTVRDDYDKVEGVEPIPSRIDAKTGEIAKVHLLSKPKRFVGEDRGKKEAQRQETERALLRGKNPDDPIADREDFYVDPSSQINGDRRSP